MAAADTLADQRAGGAGSGDLPSAGEVLGERMRFVVAKPPCFLLMSHTTHFPPLK